MKKSISDILHDADDKTVERIAENNKAADSRTSDRIYRKCLSRLGTGEEQVEVFKAETVRRSPKFYPAIAVFSCLVIIFGTLGIMLKNNSKMPKKSELQIDVIATGTNATENETVTSNDTAVKSTSKTDTAETDVKTTKTTKTSAVNDVKETVPNEKTVITVIDGTAAKKTTASKSTKTGKTTAKTTTTVSSMSSQGTKQLTTKDIISLAQKGDDLTWSDFEGYIHEDIGSGLYIWEFRIEEGSGFTLWVGGTPPDKPMYIRLYRGINKSEYPSINGLDTENCIDIRYGDVSGFLDIQQPPETVSQILGTKLCYSTLIADGVQSIEVSNTFYNNTAAEKLTYDQIKQIIPLILNVELICEDNSYQLMSINYSTIKIKTHNGRSVTLRTQGGHFIIDGVGYKAESSSIKELDQFINSILVYAKTPENIDLSGHSVWCWHDYWTTSFDSRNMNESITVSAFPDTLFTWIGLDSGVTVYKNGTAAASFGGMPLWNAYFTDINGDGSPELCMTVSFGSGMVDEHIIVYDIRNNKDYTLWERMEYDYILFKENNELFVRKTDSESLFNSNWKEDMSIGEKAGSK